jgi:hypothetical protein
MKRLLPLSLAVILSAPLGVEAKSLFLPKSCVPKRMATTEVKSTSTLAIIAYRGSTYHYLAVFGKRKNERLRAIIRRNGGCFLSFVDPGEAYSLSEGVPQPVAKSLAVLYYKSIIQGKGGLPIYQRWLNTQKAATLAPEDAYALKALGVNVPKGTKVLPWSQIKEKERKVN